jgi:small-conductance mechanosensitive channel
MESFERRGLVMLVVVALLLLHGISFVPSPTWLVAVYIIGLTCLTAASVLLVVVIAPAGYIGRWDSERARLLFFAFALLVADVAVTALVAGYTAAQTHPG